MSDITTEQAKAAVREFLSWEGDPRQMRNSGVGGAYVKLWDATRDWADSPESPDPPDALAAFKARVAAAIKGFYDAYWGGNLVVGRAGNLMNSYFAPILAECEQPAPPKPKFAVGQIAVLISGGHVVRIASVEPYGRGYTVAHFCVARSTIFHEDALRPLTPEEKG